MFIDMRNDQNNQPVISIVIPTLNEEKPLSSLFDCLEKQTRRDFEIIVADAGSDDNTGKIAEQRGALITEGGLPGVGRNRGARQARGEYLLFLDADVQIGEDFLEKGLSEMQQRHIEIAGCEAIPMSNLTVDRVIHKSAFLLMKATKETNPRLPGYCMFFKKGIFDAVGGFDEEVQLAEDYDLVRRAAEIGTFDLLDSVQVHVSMRRFDKEGRLPYIGKSIRLFFHRKTKGEVRDNSIEYDFDNFEGEENSVFREQLTEIETKLRRLDEKLRDITLKNKKIPRGLARKIQRIGDSVDKLFSEAE